MTLLKIGQDGIQVPEAAAFRNSHAQLIENLLAFQPGLIKRVFKILLRFFQHLQHDLPGGRQRNRAVAAVEQRNAPFLFQQGNLLANRGLGDVMFFRCPAEAAQLGKCEKIFKL